MVDMSSIFILVAHYLLDAMFLTRRILWGEPLKLVQVAPAFKMK